MAELTDYDPVVAVEGTHEWVVGDTAANPRKGERLSKAALDAALKAAPFTITDPSGDWELSVNAGTLQITKVGGSTPFLIGSTANSGLLTVGVAGSNDVLILNARIRSTLLYDTQIASPASPLEGRSVSWFSDGTGAAAVTLGAAAGDFCTMTTQGGTTRGTIDRVHATGTVIP